MNRRQFIAGFGSAVGMACWPVVKAKSAEFLEHPITAVVGCRPGGGTDFVSRAIAPLLEPITDWIPELKGKTPFGGGSTMGLRRDVDRAILTKIADAWQKAAGSDEFAKLEAQKPRFPGPVTGEAADKNAALWECIAANLLYEAGKAKVSPGEIGIPKIEDFEDFWPPKGYSPRI